MNEYLHMYNKIHSIENCLPSTSYNSGYKVSLRFTQIASQLLIAVECYRQFITLDEMKALVKGKLKEPWLHSVIIHYGDV